MKNGNKLEKLLIERFDRIEQKVDKLMEDIIPGMKVDIAVGKSDSKTSAKIIAGIGSLIGVAVATAMAYFK